MDIPEQEYFDNGILMVALSHPIFEGFHLLTMASCGLFTAALIILGLITIVRWLLPDPDQIEGMGDQR